MQLLNKSTSMSIVFMSVIIIMLITQGCSNELDVIFPEWGDNSLLGNTTPLSDDMKSRFEGVYTVEQGSDQFGTQIIIKWNGDYLAVYTGKNTGYFIMQAGKLDSVVYLEGFWRYQFNEKTGLSQFRMTQGSSYVLGTSTDSTEITLQGTWSNGQSNPDQPVTFKFSRRIKPELLQNKYYIISHHGSGGGPAFLPQTENTIEICKIIERYGANGIELDVRVSKDGIPFMYHDNSLNPRLVQKGSLVGKPEEYTFKELQSFVRLKHGEQIPSLEALLDAIISETTLEFIYVDCKPTAEPGLGTIAAIVLGALDKAASLNRNIEIYIAITTEDLFNAFLQLPNYQDIPTICELDIDKLQQMNAKVWSPRFTEGTQNSTVASLHGQGIKTITWTVNIPEQVYQYLTEGIFDGMLTDYPAQLAFYYYGQ
jgi:glycerophosphoryl diester phosphodiesterase